MKGECSTTVLWFSDCGSSTLTSWSPGLPHTESRASRGGSAATGVGGPYASTIATTSAGCAIPARSSRARVSGTLCTHLVVQSFLTGFPGIKCQRKYASFVQTRRHSHRVCGSGSPLPLWSGDVRPRLARRPPEGARAPPRGPDSQRPRHRIQARVLRKIRPGPFSECLCLGMSSDDAGTVGGTIVMSLFRTRAIDDYQSENPVGSLCYFHQARLVRGWSSWN